MERKITILLLMTIFGLLAMCGSARAVDGSGLIAHWKFDEGSGTTAYDSAGSNDGTLMGNPVWTDGQVDGALMFDGVDDYVNLGNDSSLKPSLPVTLTAWVKSNNLTEHKHIISLDTQDGYNRYYGIWLILGQYRDDINVAYCDGGGAGPGSRRGKNAAVTLNEGVWYHVTAIINGPTDMSLYVNGLDAGGIYKGTGGSLVYSNNGNSSIGTRQNDRAGSEYHFNGTIDDVRIYDRALSTEEIGQLYQEGLGELIGLEIVGPNEVAENFEAQYRAIAHYDNSNTKDVTASADWSVEPNDIADIDAGLLETEEIDRPQDVTITAEYTEGDNTFEAEKAVTILPICPSGYALEFDGENDYVDMGDQAELEGFSEVSIAAWIYWSGSGGHYFIAGKERVYKITISNSHINFLTGNNWAGTILTSSDAIQQNTWYHIASTYDGAIKHLYINGVKDESSVSTSGSVETNTRKASIGAFDFGGSWRHYFNGIIDEVAIFNRALSAEDIQELMHTRPDTDDPTLVACWSFDEGEGEITGDSSGNGNDGAIVGAAWIQSDAPIGICTNIALDIKPGSCPNPLNVMSKGILPVAILCSEDFDVMTIDVASIRLAGVAPIRSNYEDVATPVADGNECECTTEGPDGYIDLTLKFKTEQIVEQLIDTPGGLTDGQTLGLNLSGELFDDIGIAGSDCVVLVGNVPKWLEAKRWDGNEDGIVNLLDLAELAEYWLQSTVE